VAIFGRLIPCCNFFAAIDILLGVSSDIVELEWFHFIFWLVIIEFHGVLNGNLNGMVKYP